MFVFLKTLLSLTFNVWLDTHTFINQLKRISSYIVSYRKTILDNMQLQYVYCSMCNSNSQVGKQCILLNKVIQKSIGFRAGMDLND